PCPLSEAQQHDCKALLRALMIQDVPGPLDDHCNDKPVRTAARRARTILLAVAACKASIALAESPRAGELIEKGRLIYEASQLGFGAPRPADRGQLVMGATGGAAAGLTYHPRSGFGLFEATNRVPPVTGPSLFSNDQPRAATGRRAKGMQHQEFSFLER